MIRVKTFWLTIILLFLFTDNKAQKSLGELIIHSTTKINCLYEETDDEGSKRRYEGSGTGFFYSFMIDGLEIPCVVTNKHVIKNSILGSIQFTLMDEKLGSPDYGNFEQIRLDSFQDRWIFHPDINTDLCIMPIAGIIDFFNKSGKTPYYATISDAIIPTDSIWNELRIIEEVTMVGYPNGIYDDVNNIPIVRMGQTASPLKIDFKGKEDFMINITSIPGSSGSPVYLYNEGTFNTKNSINFGSRIYFLGILYAGPVQTTKGRGEVVIDKIPVNFETEIDITVGLGICIKSTRMYDFNLILKDLIGK